MIIKNAYRQVRGTALKISGHNDATYEAWKKVLVQYVEAKERLYVIVNSKDRNHVLAAFLRAAGVSVQQHTGESPNGALDRPRPST